MTESPSLALASITAGKTAYVGIGNVDRGDDAVGVLLAESIRAAGVDGVIIAGRSPENLVSSLAAGSYDDVVFLDATDAGLSVGSVVMLDAGEIEAAYPQVSTHRFSLGTLARLIGKESGARVWLIGIQPASTEMGAGVSPAVSASARALSGLIAAEADKRRTCKRERVWN